MDAEKLEVCSRWQNYFGVFLKDLLKTFNGLWLDLYIPKLYQCQFHIPALRLVQGYFRSSNQRTEVNS